MVALLGSAVIVFQLSLPHGIDRIAERLVGLTLLVLGVYVLGSLSKGNPAPRSRFHLMAAVAQWVHWKMSSYWHDQDVRRPADKTWNYSSKSVLMIGVVHGLGAETPSQLMIFLLAANSTSSRTRGHCQRGTSSLSKSSREVSCPLLCRYSAQGMRAFIASGLQQTVTSRLAPLRRVSVLTHA